MLRALKDSFGSSIGYVTYRQEKDEELLKFLVLFLSVGNVFYLIPKTVLKSTCHYGILFLFSVFFVLCQKLFCILSRRHSHSALKGVAEIALGAKAALIGDLGQGHIFGNEQMGRVLYALVLYKFPESFSNGGFKNVMKMRFAESCALGYPRKA